MNSHGHLHVHKALFTLALRVHSHVQSRLNINTKLLMVYKDDSVSCMNSTFCRGLMGFESDVDLAGSVVWVCDGWRWEV